jgi:hypothetical protein
METLILHTRQRLQQESDLGEYGAAAVQRALRQRRLRNAPPPGWYLPEVAADRTELDQIDIVEGLKIKDGPLVEVLNAVSLHGGLVASWPQTASVTARGVQKALLHIGGVGGCPGMPNLTRTRCSKGPTTIPISSDA